MNKINSAHSLLKAIGGNCLLMLNGLEPNQPKTKPKQIKGAFLKKLRNYHARYSHVLSDYIAEKQKDVIQREAARARADVSKSIAH